MRERKNSTSSTKSRRPSSRPREDLPVRTVLAMNQAPDPGTLTETEISTAPAIRREPGLSPEEDLMTIDQTTRTDPPETPPMMLPKNRSHSLPGNTSKNPTCSPPKINHPNQLVRSGRSPGSRPSPTSKNRKHRARTHPPTPSKNPPNKLNKLRHNSNSPPRPSSSPS